MAATFIAAANDPASSDSLASSRAAIKPAGAQVAVFFVSFWIGDGDTTITPPAGAVLRNNTVVGAARTATYVSYVDGDTTGTTYTFTFTGSKWSALKAVFFADVDDALDLAAVPFNTANAGGTSYATTTVTTVNGAALAWSGNAGEYSSPPTHTQPTGFTETGDTNLSASAYRASPGDGSQSASGASTSVSVNNKISALVALAPSAGTATNLDGTDATQVQTATTVTLTQVHQLAAASALQAQIATQSAVAQGVTLSPASALHAQEATSAALTQTHQLVSADAVQAQTATDPFATEDSGASINLILTALTPVLRHGSATTPELADHTALTPELAHGDIGHTLGHGQPGPPTT